MPDALRRLHLHVAAPPPARWLPKCLSEALFKLFLVPPVLLCNVTFVQLPRCLQTLNIRLQLPFVFCTRLTCMFGDTLVHRDNSSSPQPRPRCSKSGVLVSPSSRHLANGFVNTRPWAMTQHKPSLLRVSHPFLHSFRSHAAEASHVRLDRFTRPLCG